MADRIIMMESNPGRIRFIKENKLPRPRNYHSQEFLNVVDELHDAYFEEEKRPIEEPIIPLFPVTADEILGFLSYVRGRYKIEKTISVGAGMMDHFFVS